MNNAVNNRLGTRASFVVRESKECRVDRNLQLYSSMTRQKCLFSKEGDWVILLWKKIGSDYAASSTAGAFLYKCGKRGGMINSQSVGYSNRTKEPWVHP